MAGLGDTTAAIRRYRRAVQTAAAGQSPAGKLTPIDSFGPNPGDLRMFSYLPEGVEKPALVVVLHGCGQTGEGYAVGAGWLTTAQRYGFALLVAEQRSSNNPNRCFNWFEPGDIRRGQGEAASIRQMVAYAVERQGVDPARVFVTGLSAGGAMTNVMLAAYPEVFAGGAIIAGLPYGGAGNVQEAFASMMQTRARPAAEWGRLVRQAAAHGGRWPTVSVWHGDADTTVSAANAREIVKQWRDVHGLKSSAEVSQVAGQRREVWRDADGAVKVTAYTIAGMGHGAPLAASGPDGCGAAGPFLLEVGLSSTLEIAREWGLATGAPRTIEATAPSTAAAEPAWSDVEGVIRKALGAAGLLR